MPPSPGSSLARGALFVLVVLEELLARDLLLRDLGELDQEVDHLLLEDRRPYPRNRAGILPVILPDLLLAAGNLARALDDRAGDLVLGHRDVVLLADFRKHEAEPYASLGNAAVFLARLFLGRALVGEGAALCLEVVLDCGPHVLELVLRQRRRQRELVHRIEMIEQLALEPLAAVPGVLLLETPLDRLLELVEGLEPERLRKGLVDRDRARRLDRFRRHVELGRLAGKLLAHVVGGERDLHEPRLAGGHADELILEAGNERSRSDIDADVAAGAALERRAVDLAGEIDHDAIALLDLRPLPFGGERSVLFGDLLQ